MDHILLIAPLLGFFVGLLMGLTGAGGGILSVPLLIFGLNLEINRAAPISLAAVAISAGIGAFLGFRSKLLRYKMALFMGAFGLLLSPLGLWLGNRVPNAPLMILLSLILFLVARRMFLQAKNELNNAVAINIAPPCRLSQLNGKLIWTFPCARILMVSGATAGFLSGLVGVGGGFVIVPSLKKFTDLPMKSIVATSLGILTIVTAGSALLASVAGKMEWPIALPFISGSVVGLLIGKQLIEKINSSRVQQLFAIFTFCVAGILLGKGVLKILG